MSANPVLSSGTSLRDEDRQFVELVEMIAKENGFEPMGTVGRYSASPQPILDHMIETIQESDCVIMAATPRYIQTDVRDANKVRKVISGNVHSEGIIATIYKKPLLVFVLEGTDIGPLLPASTQYIELKENNEKDLENKKGLITSYFRNTIEIIHKNWRNKDLGNSAKYNKSNEGLKKPKPINEEIAECDNQLISDLIKKFKIGYKDEAIKRFEKMSRETKLYSSDPFYRFLMSIRAKDKHMLYNTLNILGNLIFLSKRQDTRVFEKIVKDNMNILKKVFTSTDEFNTYSYGKVEDILKNLDLSNDEWCDLHLKRIKNFITGGIDDIPRIYENISYVRGNCKVPQSYQRFLRKKDRNSGIKTKVDSLLISD